MKSEIQTGYAFRGFSSASSASSVVNALRNRVVQEARTWLRTPYVWQARVKGAGADCATFLEMVYADAGIFVASNLPDLSPQWFLHADREWYLEYLARYAVEYNAAVSSDHAITRSRNAGSPDDKMLGSPDHGRRDPRPGDILCARHGRAYSHGAIVTAWPLVIHCFPPCVMESNVLYNPVYLGRPLKFFDPFANTVSRHPSPVPR